jgi:hypothetical protein
MKLIFVNRKVSIHCIPVSLPVCNSMYRYWYSQHLSTRTVKRLPSNMLPNFCSLVSGSATGFGSGGFQNRYNQNNPDPQLLGATAFLFVGLFIL